MACVRPAKYLSGQARRCSLLRTVSPCGSDGALRLCRGESGFLAGAEVASIAVSKFTGHRGDIATAIGWNDGAWTAVMERKPVPGSKSDIQFHKLDDDYAFGLATFDNVPVRHAMHPGPNKHKFAMSSLARHRA